MVLVQKWPFLQLFCLGNIAQETNCLLRHSKMKQRLCRLKKQEVQKVEKLTFFKRGKAMVLVQKWPFFQLFFLGNIGQEDVFYDILERRNALLGYKNKKLKKSKN